MCLLETHTSEARPGHDSGTAKVKTGTLLLGLCDMTKISYPDIGHSLSRYNTFSVNLMNSLYKMTTWKGLYRVIARAVSCHLSVSVTLCVGHFQFRSLSVSVTFGSRDCIPINQSISLIHFGIPIKTPKIYPVKLASRCLRIKRRIRLLISSDPPPICQLTSTDSFTIHRLSLINSLNPTQPALSLSLWLLPLRTHRTCWAKTSWSSVTQKTRAT